MLPLIYASTISRLHAERAVNRLHQTGIGAPQVSVFHPGLSRPNHALWTYEYAEFPLSTGETILVSGFLRSWLEEAVGSGPAISLAEKLRDLGLLHEQCRNIEGCLRNCQVVVAVAEWDEFRVPVIVESLQAVGAENIRHAMIDDRRAAILGFCFQAPEIERPVAQFGFGRVPA